MCRFQDKATDLSDRLRIPSRLVGNDDTTSNTGIFVNHVDTSTVPSDDPETRRCRLVQLRFRELADSHYFGRAAKQGRSSGGEGGQQWYSHSPSACARHSSCESPFPG